MDRVHQQYAAALGLPAPTPWRLIIFRGAFPSSLDRGEIGLSGDPQIDEPLGLLHPVAKAILKDRHDPSGCRVLGGDHLIDLGEREHQRLLTDDLLACRKCREDLPKVEGCWRANVDNIDVVHAQHIVEGRGAPRDRELVGNHRQPRRVDVAQRLYAKLIGVPLIALGDVVAAHAASDHCNPK